MTTECPHCGEDEIEVCVDAYVVYSFKGFDGAGYPLARTYEVPALRTDEFEDYRVVCGSCGTEIDYTMFVEPVENRGNCYECGERALFCAPDRYGNALDPAAGPTLTQSNLLCGIHAANVVAFEGERIIPLFFDDTDYGTKEPPEEWVRVQNAYPLITNKEDN